MRKFTSLKDVLPLALGQVAAKTTGAALLQPIWEEIVGPAIAINAQPQSLVLGTLLIQTVNRAWAEELARRSPQLLPRLQQQLGGPRVLKDLSFKVKG